MSESNHRIAFFLPDLSAGGTEKVVVLLANAAARLGVPTDLLVSRLAGPLRDRLDSRVRLIGLGCRWKYGSVRTLASYLSRERPCRLYSALNGANLIAVTAARLAGSPTQVVVGMHNHFEEKLRRSPSMLDPLRRSAIRWTYRRAFRVVGVSQSICDMLTREWKLDTDKVVLIRNPLDFDALEAANEPVAHPFFNAGCPILLAAGRLCRQKDYATMLNGFALVRARVDARLIVLGEGDLRPALERQIRTLRLEDSVDLHGYVSNPLAWMRRADCYLLSSLWEGSPLAIIEAMSVGIPIVATDCESGPRELLLDYPMGRLSPVGDSNAFANAVLESLNTPRTSFDARNAFADREPETVVNAYLNIE